MRKTYRVKKEKEFQRIIHRRESFANRNLVVYILPKPGQEHFRVGLSVGKKIGNAVERNRVKRQIRQSLLDIKMDIQPEYDFVLIARVNIKSLTTAEVRKNVQHVLKLANIMKTEGLNGE